MKMSEIWNLSTLCRCCHADGHFKSLKLSYEGEQDLEIYEIMLRETLGISISSPQLEASYTICEDCIMRLRDANKFKNQVLVCEEKFKVYCENEQFFTTQDVKIEEDDDINNTFDLGNDLQMETEDHVDVYVEVKKEYSIEVDIKHPIEELKNEKPIEDENIRNAELSNVNKLTKKSQRKQGLTGKKDIEKERRRVHLDHSLILQVKTDTGTQFSCNDCGGHYQTRKQLIRHIYLKHAKVYKCEYCPKQLKSYYIYKTHVQRHTSKKFQCPHCQKILSGKGVLEDHINSHTKQNIYQCDMCQKQFMYKQSLRKHLKIHYGTNKKTLCDLCGNSFNDHTHLNIHIKTVHEKLRPYECKECGKKYSTNRHLRDHSKIHDGVTAQSKLHKCEICGHMLCDPRQMTIHRLKHDNKFMCHICHQIFDDFQKRRDHVKNEHRKVFPCPICGKVFVNNFSLNRHINDHKGIKKFSCEICGMFFSQKCGLKRHIFRKHNPDADFEQDKTKCDICKRSYKNISEHIDRHHKNRCACDICGKTYTDNSALNRHKAQKHFGRTFDCDVCDKKYLQRTRLNMHMIKVHKIKNFENQSKSISEGQTLCDLD